MVSNLLSKCYQGCQASASAQVHYAVFDHVMLVTASRLARDVLWLAALLSLKLDPPRSIHDSKSQPIEDVTIILGHKIY